MTLHLSQRKRPCLTLSGFEPVIPLNQGLWNLKLSSFLPEDKARFSCSPWIATTLQTAWNMNSPLHRKQHLYIPSAKGDWHDCAAIHDTIHSCHATRLGAEDGGMRSCAWDACCLLRHLKAAPLFMSTSASPEASDRQTEFFALPKKP